MERGEEGGGRVDRKTKLEKSRQREKELQGCSVLHESIKCDHLEVSAQLYFTYKDTHIHTHTHSDTLLCDLNRF